VPTAGDVVGGGESAHLQAALTAEAHELAQRGGRVGCQRRGHGGGQSEQPRRRQLAQLALRRRPLHVLHQQRRRVHLVQRR